MSGYGGGYNTYPPSLYGQQQLLTNYPANSAYYNNGASALMTNGGGYGVNSYYPTTNNANYLGGYNSSNFGYYGGGGYGMNGYGGGAAYGQQYYLPYKQSTWRTIINRFRHGSAYANYPYYYNSNGGYPGMGYDYGRYRGSWNDYQ